MSYLPLARKYRPQTFEDLHGQPHVTTTLTRALAGQKVAQAYLFTGQRGVGKTSAARIFAKCLNCEKGPTPTPCNACPSCAQITQGNSLDVMEIDGASNRGIDEIRNLRESVPFAPAAGNFRIYIIDEVHMLTTEAFNALLKTLEEPPAHVKFIFATTAVNKVPATILSRCQRFDFRRIEPGAVVKVLQTVANSEKISAEEPALFAIARASDGSLRDAEVVLEQLASFVKGPIREADVTSLLGAIESDTLFAWTQAIIDRDAPAVLGTLAAQIQQGKEVMQLLLGLLRHVRNLAIVRNISGAPGSEALVAHLVDEPADHLKRLQEQAGRLPSGEWLLLLQLLLGAYDLMRRSPMPQTVLELVLIRAATREPWQSLDEISRRLEQLGRSGAASSSDPVRAAVPRPAPVQAAPVSTPPRAAVPLKAEAVETTPQPPVELSSELLAIWPPFLEQLGSQKMSLAAYLADARPLQLDEGRLTVGLPGFALHQEVLSVPEHRRIIEKLLSELYQRKVSVEYSVLPADAAPASAALSPSADPAAPAIVQDIVKLFNATVLDRPRPT